MKSIKTVSLLLYGSVCFYITSCTHKQPEQDLKKLLAISAKKHNPAFIDERYFYTEPLAQIINVPTHTELKKTFTLLTKQSIEIYSVGEILYNISDKDKKYYLCNDDIELFFDLRNRRRNRSNLFSVKDSCKSYVFTYNNSEMLEQEGVLFKEQRSKKENTKSNTKRIVEIQIPWKNIDINVPKKRNIGFDISIGDNDNGFFQESKLAWASCQNVLDMYTTNYGKLCLDTCCTTTDNKQIVSKLFTPIVDGQEDPQWKDFPSYAIDHLVHGTIKDRYDLSARIRCCWDNNNIYFLVNINDSERKVITKKKLKERGIFLDYAWLEDDHSRKIWEMQAKNSIYAGGAFKNQKQHATLQLPAGTYTINYISDESHSYNDWTVAPPTTPFYGVVVYKTQ